MREFGVLIVELLLVAFVQTIIESFLDAEKREKQIRVVNIAGILASYLLLIRFVFTHLLEELTAFMDLPFS